MTVVIVNFQAEAVVARAIEALARQSSLPRRLLIIDNSESDEDVPNVDWRFANAVLLAGISHVVSPSQNLGFATANNRAIAMCDTEFVALLNPDAFPHPDWLEKLLAAAERHPE
ncbi:MAG: glycosyltransferase family 2 protein, partial [Planctomycetia bacterium]